MKISLWLSALLMPLSVNLAHADSATWDLNPTNNDWRTAANWTPARVPNGPNATAIFDVSNITDIIVTGAEVAGIVFNPGASSFTIEPGPTFSTFLIEGFGISNNSGIAQTFLNPVGAPGEIRQILFSNSASAGTATNFINNGGGGSGLIEFSDTSSAATGVFTNNGGSDNSSNGGAVFFLGSSTASHGTFINNGGAASEAVGATMQFADSSTADAALIITNGGTNGGRGATLAFSGSASGGTSRVEIFGDASLDISLLTATGVTIGSIEGTGTVHLSDKQLTVGVNNLSTRFSGIIRDLGGQMNHHGGSLIKVGTGTLILSAPNNYTGGTTLGQGALMVNSTSGSGTGSGAVEVTAGTLGGKGIIAGPTTIGSGSGAGSFLAPSFGASQPSRLTIQDLLIFESDGIYSYKLDTNKAKADQVIANSVTIESGAQFDFNPVANNTLTLGKVFTAISNTAATAISGTFANLADGSTVTVGVNKLQVSYSGGDGNDLTLTVVP